METIELMLIEELKNQEAYPVEFYLNTPSTNYYYTDNKTWDLSKDFNNPYLIPLINEIRQINQNLLTDIQFIGVIMINEHKTSGIPFPTSKQTAIKMNYLFAIDPTADTPHENGLVVVFSIENSRIFFHKRTKGKVSNELGGS